MIKDDFEYNKFHPFTYFMSFVSLSYCLYIKQEDTLYY